MAPASSRWPSPATGPCDLGILNARKHVVREQQYIRDEEIDCDESHMSSWKRHRDADRLAFLVERPGFKSTRV